MDRAIDAGIDFFDTAEMYPVPPSAELFGVTEQIVGKWLPGLTPGKTVSAYVIAANEGGEAAPCPTVAKVVGA